MTKHECHARGAAFVLGAALAISFSSPIMAEPSQPADAPVFSTGTTLADNLKSLTGKRVTIHLKSGTLLSGTVRVTSDHLLHLEKLEGKDYFDALILLQEIAAIDTRARSPGR